MFSFFLSAIEQINDEVQGRESESVQLRCEVSDQPRVLFWDKVDDESRKQIEHKTEFISGEITSYDERFTMDENYTLTIQDVRASDEGTYLCHFIQTDSISEKVFLKLTVLGKLHYIHDSHNVMEIERKE